MSSKISFKSQVYYPPELCDQPSQFLPLNLFADTFSPYKNHPSFWIAMRINSYIHGLSMKVQNWRTKSDHCLLWARITETTELGLKCVWSWKDETVGPEITITRKIVWISKVRVAGSRTLESEGQNQWYCFFVHSSYFVCLLILFETLCFDLLKLRVGILIICVCLLLRKYSVNAHCDLNIIISCPEGRAASMIGVHSQGEENQTKLMSIYLFTGRETHKSFLMWLSWSPECSCSSSGVFWCMDVILLDVWFSPV